MKLIELGSHSSTLIDEVGCFLILKVNLPDVVKIIVGNESCIIQDLGAAKAVLNHSEHFKNNFHIVKINIQEENL